MFVNLIQRFVLLLKYKQKHSEKEKEWLSFQVSRTVRLSWIQIIKKKKKKNDNKNKRAGSSLGQSTSLCKYFRKTSTSCEAAVSCVQTYLWNSDKMTKKLQSSNLGVKKSGDHFSFFSLLF